MSAKHADVIAGAIVVLVLGVGWTLIDAGGVGGEGEIPVGKIGKFRIGINLVEGLATTGYFTQCISIVVKEVVLNNRIGWSVYKSGLRCSSI